MIDANGDFHPRTCFTAGTKIRMLKKSVAMKIRNPKDIPVTKEFEELVNIEDLRRGDYVLSWNEKTGRQTYSKVTDTYTKKTDEVYILTLQSGEKIEPPGSRSSPLAGLRFARRRLCKARRNHSFRVLGSGIGDQREKRIAGKPSVILKTQTLQVSLYSTFGQSEEKPDSKNSEWKEARRLKKGDVLFDSTGRQLRIRNVSVEKRSETVYIRSPRSRGRRYARRLEKPRVGTVEGEHDYYVGEDGVLVHNEGCGKAESIFGTVFGRTTHLRDQKVSNEELNYFTVSEIDKVKSSKFEGVNNFEEDISTKRQEGNKLSYKNKAGVLTEYEFQKGGGVKVRIDGKEIQDGSVVYVGKDGKMKVMNAGEVKEGAILYVNGVLTDPKYAHDQAKSLSYLSKENIYLVYNGTNGGIKDFVNAGMDFFGFGQENSMQTMKALIESRKVRTIVGHSQGGIIAKNAINESIDLALTQKNLKYEEYLKNISFRTFGSPNIEMTNPGNLTAADNQYDIMYYNPLNSPAVSGTGRGHDAEHYMYDMKGYLNTIRKGK